MAIASSRNSTKRGTSHSLLSTLFFGLLVLSILAFAQHPLVADTTERVSVATDGTQGNAESRDSAISADGRFVSFVSEATALVAGDTNGSLDVFVRDRLTGQTERVSVASDGTQGDSASWAGNISGNGRYVAFSSLASNLAALDDNAAFDVFVHDRQTGQTERVSVATDGTQGDENSWNPAISSDGRYVAFESHATTLVAGDANAKIDVFVHDRATGQTERVSVATDGTQGDADSWQAAISADGRYVGFHSYSGALVAADTNGKVDVFVHDRLTGETQRVSVASDGTQGDGNSECPSLSADGRYVAFASYATTLVPFDTNDIWDVFVHDRHTGQTQRVSVTTSGAQVKRTSRYPSISADGRYVAFHSGADEYVTDYNNSIDIFLHDRQTAHTQRVSVTSGGAEASGDSEYPAVSADGRCVAFRSAAEDLVVDDTNGVRDVFVRTRPTADFAATPTSGYAPLFVDFTDLSTGAPTSWEWHFGDGGSSTAQHPTHEYLSAGSYTVTLTVYGAGSPDTKTRADYVVVLSSPTADFSTSPTSGIAPLTVSFTDLSAGDPTSWEWDFGDGATSSEQNPSHEYLTPGSYSVSLTAANVGGSDTETKPDCVTVLPPPPPTAGFSATPTTGIVPLTASFTDLSDGDPISWLWHLGDGSTSVEQNPSHEYEKAGSYTVSLTATNAGGSDTETKTHYIVVNFTDVATGEWFYDEVMACVSAGIVE
ncbi:MAG: PKD domain-containing protein, partial [Gemmatimonadota bacterium]